MNDHADVQAAKRQLRQTQRSKSAESAPLVPTWSNQLARSLLESEIYRDARTIMAFFALSGEPDLSLLLQDALAKGRRLCLPRVDWDAGAMEPEAITSLENLTRGRHGLQEPPPQSQPVPQEELDLILVPGLAFDSFGNRLGRGAGFYDRFLSACLPRTVICGICFENQLVDRIPTDPWDVPMNVVSTERRLITLQP